MLAAGTLKDRIVIERQTTGTDAIGQPIDAWSVVANPLANIRYPSGVSTIKSGADVSTVRASIRIRYRAGLDAGMRVTATGRVFDIKAVLPNRAEGYVDLVCECVQ
jgi:SPP1 family predicted phage head-tail adaptor